jgi:uncharacterized protein YbjT (DUF2867 family)
MRVFVAGATGAVGRRLVPMLLASGHEVIGSSRSPRRVERLRALGATEVHWDKRPPDADYVILADPEGNRFCVVDVTR